MLPWENHGRIKKKKTGHASFIVNYEAIVFRPFKSQVLDAKVTLTHEHGFNATVGLHNFSIFVSKHNMPREFEYRAEAEMWTMEDEDGAVEVRGCARGERARLRAIASES